MGENIWYKYMTRDMYLEYIKTSYNSKIEDINPIKIGCNRYFFKEDI
jgi:hypothetical protein